MDNLKLLETKIDELLVQHERVRKERDGLLAKVKERETECAQLGRQVKHLEHERSELKGRLERILSRLEALDLG